MKLLNKYLRGRDWLIDQYNRNRKFEDHIKPIDTDDLADEISFRLLATRNHVDFERLVDKLTELKNVDTKKKPILPCVGHAFEVEDNNSDYGDAFEY